MVRQRTQTSITLQSVTCSPISPSKMMSWAGSYVSLCECFNYGSKRILISTPIERPLLTQFVAIGSPPLGALVCAPTISGSTAAATPGHSQAVVQKRQRISSAAVEPGFESVFAQAGKPAPGFATLLPVAVVVVTPFPKNLSSSPTYFPPFEPATPHRLSQRL
jgi:hypothetical protein